MEDVNANSKKKKKKDKLFPFIYLANAFCRVYQNLKLWLFPVPCKILFSGICILTFN